MNLNFDIKNIVRTVIFGGTLLPVSIGLAGLFNVQAEISRKSLETDDQAVVIKGLKSRMQLPCIQFVTSKNDSKLEREAKNQIDEVLGGEVNHGQACNFILN